MKLAATVLAAAAALALVPGAAVGERTQRGNLIVSLDGGIAPLRLPRDRPAPVAVRIGGEIRTDDGSPLPRVTRTEIALAGSGLLSTHGLPTCPRARLRNATGALAMQRCRAALVGSGRLEAEVFVPEQAPFTIHASLLAFNGSGRGGGAAVWVHAYSADPPVSLVLPFLVRHQDGAFRTVLTAALPRAVGTYPHLARFQLNLSRKYTYRGQRRSFLSASCPVPPSLTAGFLTFARATYSFDDERSLSVDSVRSCRAR